MLDDGNDDLSGRSRTLRALKGARRSTAAKSAESDDDGYIMEQTLIAGSEAPRGRRVSREALGAGSGPRRGSTLRQLHERNAEPLKDTRSLDIETQREEIQQRFERKDRARELIGPPVALVGALARVLGTVTNLHGNDIGTFTGRS